ncbi:fumarylacetoacetate hydrolase family protein [Gynuella sp.]|uniref:fumarylacetoacetate hydrolase family protein n=1 Tax=Gynuella sp. TaxID=2969146 RepID=UPI003D0EAA2D
MFEHRYTDNSLSGLMQGKILCVGRNYAEHAKELNNPLPQRPLIFIKPSTAATSLLQPFQIPQNKGAVHHELELALLITRPLTRASEEEAVAAVGGIGLALDLTLRDVQDELKQKGQPWEVAKAFDGSCPLSGFVKVEHFDARREEVFTLHRNGKLQQHGRSSDMIFKIPMLLSYMSHIFTLLPGDVVLTGTPAGVGPLQSGDELRCSLEERFTLETRVL